MRQVSPAPCGGPALLATVPPFRHPAALARFDAVAHRPGNPELILQEACRSAVEGVDAGYAGMLQYRVGERSFVLQAGVGMPARFVGRARIAAGLETTAGLAGHADQPIHFRRFPAGDCIWALDALTGQGVHRLVSVPVPREGGAAFGVLEVGSAEAGEFAPSDLLLLQVLADGVGAAVERHADRARRADRATMSAERHRAMQDASRPPHVVLNAAKRHHEQASGSGQDTRIQVGGD